MTCAQGLLRLLWGGAEVGVLRDWINGLAGVEASAWRKTKFEVTFFYKLFYILRENLTKIIIL